MAHTFTVDENPISEWFLKRLSTTAPFQEHQGVKAKLRGRNVYASGVSTVGGNSPFFNAVSYAFNGHCPLVITPDNLWLTVMTGLCHHIDTDPEGLRHHFVQHEGQAMIEVRVGSLPGLKNAPWEDAIMGGPRVCSDSASFAEQIRDHIGKKYDLIVNDFSTTTAVDRVSAAVALMGAMKHYFEYKMMMLCGLNRVTVAGTPDDWGSIIDRTRALSELGLGWWTDELLPVLDQIRSSCEGRPDVDFWRRIYLEHGKGSGGDYDVSGWINTLFPYIAGKRPNSMQRNEFVAWQADHGHGNPGVDRADFPFGMVSAPVTVNDHGTEYKCEFYGGLVGVSVAEDFTVQAVSGIAVQDVTLEADARR